MWMPRQEHINASVASGNMSLGSNNPPASSYMPVERGGKADISEMGLWALVLGIAMFFYVLGAIVVCCVPKRKMEKGYIRVCHQDHPQPFSTGDPQKPPQRAYLHPHYDKWVSLGFVRLELFSTRRRLLKAYNEPSGLLGVQNSVAEAWEASEVASDYLEGFKLDDITLSKSLRARETGPR